MPKNRPKISMVHSNVNYSHRFLGFPLLLSKMASWYTLNMSSRTWWSWLWVSQELKILGFQSWIKHPFCWICIGQALVHVQDPVPVCHRSSTFNVHHHFPELPELSALFLFFDGPRCQIGEIDSLWWTAIFYAAKALRVPRGGESTVT